MNIFYLCFDQDQCAKEHVDKHVVKMILEYAQLLSTAHRVLDGVSADPRLYKATHVNHPSAKWVRQSDCNYVWLLNMLNALLKEYTYRYNRVHKCSELVPILKYIPMNIPIGPFSEPTPAMPDEYKVPGNSELSYKRYYIGSKTHMFSWKGREMPDWIGFS